MVSNYLLNNEWTFRDRARRGIRTILTGLFMFVVICGTGALVNWSLTLWLSRRLLDAIWPEARLLWAQTQFRVGLEHDLVGVHVVEPVGPVVQRVERVGGDLDGEFLHGVHTLMSILSTVSCPVLNSSKACAPFFSANSWLNMPSPLIFPACTSGTRCS